MIIEFLIYYSIATVLLAGIDALRIRFVTPHKKQNIRKWISWSLAIIAGGVCWWIAEFTTWWETILVAIGVRYALYDPFLNVFRGFRIDYQSDRTNSITDQAEQRINLAFWGQRIIGVVLAAAPFIIQLINGR